MPVHIVVLVPDYVEANHLWLEQFMFKSGEPLVYFFSAQKIDYIDGFIQVVATRKKRPDDSNDIKADTLLIPRGVVVGILMDTDEERFKVGFT
jgi:hypothetical protein